MHEGHNEPQSASVLPGAIKILTPGLRCSGEIKVGQYIINCKLPKTDLNVLQPHTVPSPSESLTS